MASPRTFQFYKTGMRVDCTTYGETTPKERYFSRQRARFSTHHPTSSQCASIIVYPLDNVPSFARRGLSTRPVSGISAGLIRPQVRRSHAAIILELPQPTCCYLTSMKQTCLTSRVSR
ncbi:uncharacterized protein CIMG_09614 [Coccidioides immitis RS]|uniref:Uncharacterized protein n=1 Tax=Coccidioides immitis (strain RS) TaxID=246410 RepID=A0A0D8JSW8_COCIM|nr:uncharacterized protein CIMG_09614 [Coccidioides immitis RS]KJF60445.1 hypothetical protein CIMG_09614 [Coccidioides immitis RS]